MTIPTALQDWATRWNVPAACLADLMQCMGAGDVPPEPSAPANTYSEQWTQSNVVLEAPRFGVWITRNNVGAKTWTDEKTGQKTHIRWGLANETPARNKAVKSADLIGIDGRPIEPWEVGRPRGRLVSRECKRPGWTYKGDAHEQAQLAWAALVPRYGGDARFVTGEGSFK